MPYIPNWEPIYKALKRLIRAGESEAQAKLDLCGIIADGKVKLRAIFEKKNSKEGKTVTTPYLRPPLRLNPDDLDWENSAPKTFWEVNDFGFFLPGEISLLEISTFDLKKFFPRAYEFREDVVKSIAKASKPSKAEAERKYAHRPPPTRAPLAILGRGRCRPRRATRMPDVLDCRLGRDAFAGPSRFNDKIR
jgi:hypothetical protein